MALASPHCGLKPLGIVVFSGVYSPLTPLTLVWGQGHCQGGAKKSRFSFDKRVHAQEKAHFLDCVRNSLCVH